MLTNEHIDDLLQHNGNVLSTDGEKIGSVGQLPSVGMISRRYADDTDGQLTWVTVKTGLFGTSESFVALQGPVWKGMTSWSPTLRTHPYLRRLRCRLLG